MDINEYMTQSLALQTRIALAVEAIAKREPGRTVEVVMGSTTAPVQVKEQPGNAPAPEATAATTAGSPAQEQGGAASAGSQAEQGNASASTGTQASAPAASGGSAPKPPTVDDVRTHLKVYAAKQGNPAAMAMLQKHGGNSVSAVPEANWPALIADLKAGS
jgi:hypothetical protein